MGAVVGGQLDSAGEEVRVQVGVDRIGDPQALPLRGGTHRAEIPAGVDHQPRPLPRSTR